MEIRVPINPFPFKVFARTAWFRPFNFYGMQYLSNPDLNTIRPNWPGNPFDDGAFRYVGKAFVPSFRTILRWQFSRNPQRKEKKQDTWRLSVQHDLSFLTSDKDFIIWLGHACFLIQLNGVRLITDPVLFDLPLIKRHVRLPFSVEQFGKLDYLLLSHDHRDHCDKKSLKTIFNHYHPTILTSLKMTTVIGKWVGEGRVQEAGWYQQYKTEAAIEIIFLPSQHWCRRGLRDFNQVLWGSFLIRTKETTIYFGADSSSGAHFAEIGQLFPNIDYALLGIGAYKPDYVMQEVHTSPSEAWEAFQQLGATTMIPTHYGTYDLSDEPLSEPYRLIQQHTLAAGVQDRLQLLKVGEVLWLS